MTFRSILLASAATLATSTAHADQTAIADADAEPRIAETAIVADAAVAGLYGTFADRAVSDLIGMDVLAQDDVDDPKLEEVGEVDRLVRVATGDEVLAVVGMGGFLGFARHDVALPLARFEESAEGLVLPDMTEDELEAMVEFDATDGVEDLAHDVKVDGTPILSD